MLGQSDDGSLTGWVLAGLASIIATLSTVVATLFKINQTNVQLAHTQQITALQERLEALEKHNYELTERADKCAEDREALRVEIAVIRARLETIEKQ
jgi:septal ring factor EnvC (AmiA/AmiB activator)